MEVLCNFTSDIDHMVIIYHSALWICTIIGECKVKYQDTPLSLRQNEFYHVKNKQKQNCVRIHNI